MNKLNKVLIIISLVIIILIIGVYFVLRSSISRVEKNIRLIEGIATVEEGVTICSNTYEEYWKRDICIYQVGLKLNALNACDYTSENFKSTCIKRMAPHIK